MIQFLVRMVKYIGGRILEYAPHAILIGFFFFILYTGVSSIAKRKSLAQSIYEERIIFKSLFVICLSAVLMDTLFFRPYFENPLSNVVGNWWLVSFKNGWLNNDSILNIVLFVPVTFLFIAGWEMQLEKWIGLRLRNVIVFTGVSSLIVSLLIETSQLIFHRGTFQLTDLVYNTFGGCLGGILYTLFNSKYSKLNGKRKEDGF